MFVQSVNKCSHNNRGFTFLSMAGTVTSCTPGEPERTMTDTEAAPVEGRVARNRRRRTEAFLAAGLHIVTEEGIEALTMARLADELDTAVGSVYRYFSSKAELMGAIEAQAIGQLQQSHDRSVGPIVDAVVDRVPDSAAL